MVAAHFESEKVRRVGSARDPDNTVCENGQCEGENGVMKVGSVPHGISGKGAMTYYPFGRSLSFNR